MYNFFKNLLSWRSSGKHRLNCLLNNQEVASELIRKSFKQSRRNGLIQENQSLTLTKIENKIDFIQDHMTLLREEGDDKIAFEESDVIEMLDICYKFDRQSDDTNREFIDILINLLCEKSSIIPVSKVGEKYDPLTTVVVDSIYSAETPSGSILEIISQGYQTICKGVVRKSKVIVSTQVQDKQSVMENVDQNKNILEG